MQKEKGQTSPLILLGMGLLGTDYSVVLLYDVSIWDNVCSK
jgi:hypothetical protein